MITLILAEDELYTRKGLIKHLDFSFLGIDQILEAEDGRAALRLAQNHSIDILLTDVKMPHIDGIELAKSIRALYPECIILFLSGYSDREYLRSALSLRTFRYLDKPVDIDILQEALSDAVRFCKRMQNSANYNLDETRKLFTRELISRMPKNPNFAEYIDLLSLSPSSFDCCRTILVQLLNNSTISSSTDFSPVLYEASEICNSFFKKTDYTALVSEYKEQYILIHLLSSDMSLSNVTAYAVENLFARFSIVLNKWPHFIAIGDCVHNAYELRASYASAVTYLQQNYYLGINSISPITNGSSFSYELNHEIQQSIQQSVINQNSDVCLTLLEQLYEQYHSHPATLVSNTRAAYYQLLHWIYQYHFRKKGTDTMHNESYLLDKVTGTSTLTELHIFTKHYFQNYFDCSQDSTDNQLANRIIGIIRENYSNSDLGIQFICDLVHLSASRVSSLFKNVTGETINQYIQNIRMDHAKVLLSTTELKIQDVGRKCGYLDSNYFTKLFRKKTGILPSEYREVHST